MPRYDEITVDVLNVLKLFVQPGAGSRKSTTHGANANVGMYIGPTGLNTYGLAASPAVNVLTSVVWVAPLTGLSSSIAWRLSISGGGGSQYRLGLYDADQVDIFPSNLLFDSGPQDGTVVQVNRVPMGVQLIAGHIYFLSFLCGTGSPTGTMAVASTPQHASVVYGTDVAMTTAAVFGWNIAQAFGPLPAVHPSGAAALVIGQCPVIGVTYA